MIPFLSLSTSFDNSSTSCCNSCTSCSSGSNSWTSCQNLAFLVQLLALPVVILALPVLALPVKSASTSGFRAPSGAAVRAVESTELRGGTADPRGQRGGADPPRSDRSLEPWTPSGHHPPHPSQPTQHHQTGETGRGYEWSVRIALRQFNWRFHVRNIFTIANVCCSGKFHSRVFSHPNLRQGVKFLNPFCLILHT